MGTYLADFENISCDLGNILPFYGVFSGLWEHLSNDIDIEFTVIDTESTDNDSESTIWMAIPGRNGENVPLLR